MRRVYCGAQFILCAGLGLLLASCGGAGESGSSGPSLSVSTTSVTFTATQNGPTPPTQNVGVSVAGGTVFVAITSITGTGFSASFSITGQTTGNVAVTPSAPNFAPGTYTGSITVRGCPDQFCSGGDVAGSPKVINVSYTVQQKQLTPAPAQLTFNATNLGTLPANQNVTLSTPASLPVTYTTSVSYGAGASGWLSPPPSGTAPGPASVGVNTTNLTPGTYTATLNFSTATEMATVDVAYVVAAASLTFSPTSASFTIDTTSPVAALSQSVVVGSTGAALNWTNAVSSQPWVTVSPTAGSTGTSLVLNLDPGQLDALDAGAHSATITLFYTPPNQAPTSVPLPVSLNLQLPRVVSVNPYVATSGTSLEVILRGSGFNGPGGANVNFGNGASASGTVISDTELRVTHPALVAGTYQVSVPNQFGGLGITRSAADLVVVDAPAYPATTIAYPAPLPAGATQRLPKIFYDAERKALIVKVTYADAFFSPINYEIQRYAFDGSTWSTTPTVVSVADLRDLAPTLDGKKLLATSGAALRQFDMATLAAGSFTTLPLFGTNFLDRLAVANDGNALVTEGFFGSGFVPMFKYSIATGTFTSSLFGGGGGFSLPNLGGSADGSRLVVTQNGVSPPQAVYVYNASTSTLLATSLELNANFPVLNRNGTRISISGFSIYDANLQLLGTIPGSQTLSPDGLRAYAADHTVLHTYDLGATPVAGVFPELGTGTTLPGDPGPNTAMTVSPDGGTLFIAGSDAIVVVPTP
jgi:IPT/TIG domain-containing protein/BACON domain-containing protein